MSLTGTVPSHPARFTPAILDAVRPYLVELGLPVHDPYAGEGRRLGALCDELGLVFTGTDVEPWTERDGRVGVGDSRDASTYPPADFVVVTSPVYFGNRISSDYTAGPTPSTKLAGRHSYGISRGAPLDAANMARLCRSSSRARHDAMAIAVARHWHDFALVNVDGPLRAQWSGILVTAGFRVRDVLEVVTPRLRGGLAGVDKRAACEVVMIGVRP